METTPLKILAIDDNRDNRMSLKAVVNDRLPNAKVFTVSDGRKGIDYAFAYDPDVILLDIVMPEMDGFEVCRKLKNDQYLHGIPVVFLTALRTDRESRIRALEVGAESFLSKPFDEVEIVAQIRAMAKIKAANRRTQIEKDHLEALVRERTLELQKSHTLLEERIAQRTAALTREVAERKRYAEERDQLIIELQEAMARIKVLTGLLPTCAACKKIKNAEGNWMRMEAYIEDHSNARFTHGICPTCAKELYPEIFGK